MIDKKIKFREIEITDAKKILNWRRKKRITNFQFTDIHNSIKKQKQWLMNSYSKKDYYHWLIILKRKPIGFLSVNKINLKKKETTWSWYIGSEKHLFLGGFIPPFFYNWIFKNFKINKIIAYVFKDNKNVIKIHKYHGYKACEKKTILKKNKKIEYIKLVLLKKNWNFHQYSKYVTEFPILKWRKFK